MRKYNVYFEIFKNNGHKENRTIHVEAGTKKLAVLRAMSEINKLEGYSGLFKNVVKIEEVA